MKAAMIIKPIDIINRINESFSTLSVRLSLNPCLIKATDIIPPAIAATKKPKNSGIP